MFFSNRKRIGSAEGPDEKRKAVDPFTWLDGNSGIVFSAPHNVEQYRDGTIKKAEPNTGPIVIEMNRKHGCPCIYRTAYGLSDPNYDRESEYRDFLIKKIEGQKSTILLDLHQMDSSREMDICIGTGRGRNILGRHDIAEILKEAFVKNNIRNVTIDDPFPASYRFTVSSVVSRSCSIPSVQIEMNAGLFTDDAKERRVYSSFDDIILGLEDWI